MKNSHHILKVFLFLTFSFLLLCHLSVAQEYQLHISNIEIPGKTEKTFYGRPTENDFVVYWELYTQDEDGKIAPTDMALVPQYHVSMSRGDSTFVDSKVVKDTTVTGVSSVLFADNKVGPRYYFRVEGELDGNVLKSDVAWAVNGKPLASIASENDSGWHFFPIPLFFPVAEILDSTIHVRNPIYHDSTPFGKLSFSIIWYFLFFGVGWVLPFHCVPNLRLARLFPLVKKRSFKPMMDNDSLYEANISPRFRFVIELWKIVMADSNSALREPNSKGLEDASQFYYDHFKNYGSATIEVLKRIVYFNPSVDNARELEDDIVRQFGENGHFGDFIHNPIDYKAGSEKKMLNWAEVRNDMFRTDALPMIEYPTAKILAGGLENHLINGFQWQKVSEEVDRAIENRAFSEIEILRGKSSMDWLWNLGALAPLLGLLGTVTGISKVFSQIQQLSADTSHLELVKQLSSGIFEALWTTIYGLTVGIILVTIYYYYKNILDWIYVKWQSIFVHVTERL